MANFGELEEKQVKIFPIDSSVHGVRESTPMWVDKKSRIPEEEKGIWGS